METLKDVMSDPEAPASARVAAARTALELAGDIGKHSQANQRMDGPLCEMSPEQLSAIIGHWEEEWAQVAKDITPDAGDCRYICRHIRGHPAWGIAVAAFVAEDGTATAGLTLL